MGGKILVILGSAALHRFSSSGLRTAPLPAGVILRPGGFFSACLDVSHALPVDELHPLLLGIRFWGGLAWLKKKGWGGRGKSNPNANS